MINSVNSALEKLGYELNAEDRRLADFFNENGYCVIPKSDFLSENIPEYKQIIDSLLEKESWRGGWEGKEEYMKYKKDFQPGANRLANLFNKNDLFLKLLTEKNILKTDTTKWWMSKINQKSFHDLNLDYYCSRQNIFHLHNLILMGFHLQ